VRVTSIFIGQRVSLETLDTVPSDDLYTVSVRSLEPIEKIVSLQTLELSHGRTCARIETIPAAWAAFRSLRKLKIEGRHWFLEFVSVGSLLHTYSHVDSIISRSFG
jgi:hypothetical protein